MAVRAGESWRHLEETSGRALLRTTGQLSLGDHSSLDALATALGTHHLRFEELSASEARRRFPGMAFSGPVLYEPSSGVLTADECLRAVCAVGGFSVRTGVTVVALEDGANSVRVRTAHGDTHVADVVVDCAGPAALGLLGGSGGADLATTPSAPQVAYFGAAAPSDDLPPVFIEWGDDMVYGLPVPATRLYKVSHHTPGPPLPRYDPTDASHLPDDPSLLATLTEAVRRLIPSLDPEPVRTERCIYDNTGDGDFVLDRVGRVVIGCGTSGHGFKFGPLLGELLADLAEGVAPSVDLGPFRLRRPGRPAPDGDPTSTR